jgi:acetyl-CoA C-acetyltransferase
MMKRETETLQILIVGIGMTPVGEHWEKSLRQLALDAIAACGEDCPALRPEVLFVANMLAPSLSGQAHLGPLLSDFAGLHGIETVSVEAAGASGGTALRQAYLALRSGACDVAMVLGVEKPTDRLTPELNAALAAAGDADYEAIHGATPAALAGLLMQRYFHEYSLPADALMGFSLNAHQNALQNPLAMFHRALTPEQYNRAPMISDPLCVYDAAPVADGAAALLLCRGAAIPQKLINPPVAILGSGASSDSSALHERRDPLTLAAAATSAHQALDQAGVEITQIDLFEPHDIFSIYAALSLEAVGFAKRGEGWRLAQEGEISPQGKIPLCTFGGSKARGDTGGATGVYQVAEVVMQLQNRAGPNQIPKAERGMAQCLGGSGGTAATHILARMENA